MGAMVEALAEASQHDNTIGFNRNQAPSGFEVESIEDLIAFREKQSSMAGNNQDNDDGDGEYVALSQYEVDVDEIVKMNEQCGDLSQIFGGGPQLKPLQTIAQDSPEMMLRKGSHLNESQSRFDLRSCTERQKSPNSFAKLNLS